MDLRLFPLCFFSKVNNVLPQNMTLPEYTNSAMFALEATLNSSGVVEFQKDDLFYLLEGLSDSVVIIDCDKCLEKYLGSIVSL